MFEAVYTASPMSEVNGSPVYDARKHMGKYLAETHPIEADIVVGVPESGRAAAAGYAEASGIPNVDGILKDPYAVRSFIMTGLERETILRDKLFPNASELKGKSIVLVDDSLIKGNTMRILIKMLREAGAEKVHVRLAAPRYENSCFMGMDTGDESELVARGRSDEDIAALIGADSVGFNTPENVERAVNDARRAAARRPLGEMCTACATGDYGTLASRTFLEIADRRRVDLPMPSILARI
jgi:amidophosphoribosyltransferase